IAACDDVMSRLDRKPGLIRFSSENAIDGKNSRVLRRRVMGYALGLIAVMLVSTVVIAQRQPVELYLSRQAGTTHVEMADGRVQNPLRLRVANKSDQERAFSISAVEPTGMEIVAPMVPFVVGPG